MNRIILLLILVVTFSCKDEKKKETEVVKNEVVEKKFKVVKSFTTQDLATWTNRRVSLEPVKDSGFKGGTYSLSRTTTDESAFLSSSIIPVTYASEYKVDIEVKKGTNNSLFGLRISGSYPDRVDAVFDLEKGIIVGYKASRDFENPMATIEKLNDGWYNCTLSAEVAADNVRIIMGPTGAEKSVLGWEGKTEKKEDVFFVPSSIVFEEVIIN